MKNLFLSLFVLLNVVSPVRAQEALTLDRSDLMPQMPESHNYTYIIDKDGGSQVLLRIDGVRPEATDQTFTYSLPEGAGQKVMSWYRENGCFGYTNDMCNYFGSTNWKELPATLENGKVSIVIPASKLKTKNKYNENNLTLGLAFSVDQATTKKWWGRTVDIATGASDQFVSYVNIGVYLPDGVFTRDHSQGPTTWTASMMESVNSAQNRPSDVSSLKMTSPYMIDMAGGGQIYRNRQGLMPGESYQFSFMSSTSLWKLFYPEIGFSLGWVAAIGVVISLLLRLIIGKKPLSWYFAVVGLLILLGIMFTGLWFTYRTTVGQGSSVPYPMFGGMGGGGYEKGVEVMSEPAVMEEPPVDDAMVKTEIAPMTLEAPAQPAQ